MSKLYEKDIENLKLIFKEEGFELTNKQILEEAEKLLNLMTSLLGINYKSYDK